jgi:hypothetical protein
MTRAVCARHIERRGEASGRQGLGVGAPQLEDHAYTIECMRLLLLLVLTALLNFVGRFEL